MGTLFKTYLYEPLLSVLIFIYQYLSFHDLGIAIILLTILVRVVLFPIFYKGARDQSLMSRLQPHIKKIQLDHKDDKEKQAKAMLDLYKEHRLNPFSGFFLLILQLPIFIVLFQIFTKELSNSVFVSPLFLGLIDLSKTSLVLAIAAALLQYFQGKLALPPKTNDDSNPMQQTGRMMVVIGPVFTLLILTRLPAALGLYWAVSTLFSVGQQVYINKKLPKPKDIHG